MSVEAPLPPTLSDMDTSIDSSVSASISTMDIDNQSVFADDAPADMDLDVVQSSATDNEPLTLLKLPEEVLIKILEHTVVLDKNIVVTQVCKGSNMFLHGDHKEVVDEATKAVRNVSTDDRLDFPSLMMTCKKFYDILNESAMFYKQNIFEFKDKKDLASYLSSITPARMRDIEEVILHWGSFYPLPRGIFMLAGCNNLMKLTIHCYNFYHYDVRSRLNQVRCETLNLIHYPAQPIVFLRMTTEQVKSHREELEFERVTDEEELQAMVSRPRLQIKESDLSQARTYSGVIIHGDRRLDGEINPFISSRTRGGSALKNRLNADGVQDRSEPKFNDDGNLLWDLVCYWRSKPIKGHREIINAVSHKKSVAFLAVWASKTRTGPGSDQPESWEPLEVLLSNPRAHWDVVRYYAKHSKRGKLDGGQQVRDAIDADYLVSPDESEPGRERNHRQLVAQCQKFTKAQKDFLEKEEARKEKEANEAEAKVKKNAATAKKIAAQAKKDAKAKKAGKQAGKKRKRGD